MTFKGKIDKWWYVVVALFNGITLGAMFFVRGSVIAICIVGLVVIDLYFIPVLFRNEITVDRKRVLIRFGLLKKELPTKNITKLQKTKNFSASFAASADRLGIETKGMSPVMVSVEDNNELAKELIKCNKAIKYLIV